MKNKWIALAGLLLVGSLGCAALDISLPAITDAPTGERDAGRIVWRDLITNNPAESRKFYEELFGWEFEAVGGLFGLGGEDAYSLIRHNGRLIGGMVNEERLENESDDINQWVVLMSVDDIDQAVAQFAAGPGEVLPPPTDVAERGTMAVVVDPQGALLALVQTRDGDPARRTPEFGDFLWDELWTNEVEPATGFYSELVGFDKEDVAVGETGSYRVLSKGGDPTAGVMKHPFEEQRPVWVTYLRVENPDAITARVESLGGKVYVEPQDRPLGGRVALIAGPSGAGIALQTWPFENNSFENN